MQEPEHLALQGLAEDVADRRVIDWDARLRESSPALERPLRQLRIVQRIEEFHREVSPPSEARGFETCSLDEAPVPGPGAARARTGSQWGPLTLLESLGQGASGEVFRAHDPALATDVALKLLRGTHRHLGEARKLARVRHPNVLTVHGVAIHDGQAGLWTELLQGKTLEEVLQQSGPLGAQEATLVGIELCRALSAVHGAGLVHRDVKTTNVMRESGGRIVLLDFSIGSERDESLPTSMVGTPLFMAPELFAGEDSGIATDIYSLGVTLYRLVSGRYPVQADDAQELAAAHRQGRTTPLIDARPDLPAPFVDIVQRALSHDPADRYRSAGELERALSGFVGATPAPAPAPAVRFGRTWRVAAAVALVAGLAAVLAIGLPRLTAPLDVEARWVRVQVGAGEPLDPGAIVSPGDCIELEIRGSREMYVYVINEDAVGNAAVLYPSPVLDQANPLVGRRNLRLPGTVAGRAECWRIGPGGGEERMLVAASRTALPRLEQLVADLPRATATSIELGSPSRMRGVTGLAPSPRTVERSRIAEVVDTLHQDGEPAAWVWQVHFINGGGELSGYRSQLDAIGMSAALHGDDGSDLTETALELLRPADSAERLHAAVQALELSTRATELAPHDPRACGARALALERAFLGDAAREEWNRCLTLEPAAAGRARILERQGSPTAASVRADWAEARSRLADLATPSGADLSRLVRRFPNEAGEWVERDLLPLWGRYVLDADPRAGPALERLRAIAGVVGDSIGDALLEDTIAHVDAQADRSSLARLAGGHVAYGAARAAEQAGQFEALAARLGEARSALQASPYILVADYREAIRAYRQREYDRAAATLRQVRERAEARGYRALVGLVLWMEGLNEGRQARFGAGLERYAEAAAVFDALDDATRFAAVQDLIADLFDVQGEFAAGWRHRHDAFSRWPLVTDPSVRSRMFLRVVWSAQQQGLLRVALAFGRAGLESTTAEDDPLAFIATSNRLAAIQHELGDREGAFETLAAARAHLADLDASARAESAAELAALEAGLVLETDGRLAARLLDDAIDYYERGRQLPLGRLLPLRGRAHQGAGENERAERDFVAAIDFFETHREEVARSSLVGYADLTREVYDAMVDFQLTARRRADIALDYAERGRAQLLLRFASGHSATPLTAQELAQSLPPGTTLVYYALFDDRVVIWVLDRGVVEHLARPVESSTLRSDVLALLTAVSQAGRGDEYRQLASRFHDLLVRPIRAWLTEGQLLVVVPDKALYLVPFALLLDAESGRFLVQDYRLAVAPSATLFLRGLGSRREDSSPRSLLAVSNPAFDRSSYPSLSDLPGADREVQAISRLYASASVLEHERATRQRFLAALGDHDVVHFAGHALADRTESFEARLLLAPDPATADSGTLLATDLYDSGLPRNRLVVLAACETAVGRLSTAEGPLSLARPFLAAGVPAVVANLWPIDDAGSAALFERFHEAFRATGDAPAALRQAQVALLEAEDGRFAHPRFWAAAQVFVGAGAPVR